MQNSMSCENRQGRDSGSGTRMRAKKMSRNPNPFTERQIRLLEAIRERICEINDPDPEVITHETYEWFTEQTKQFGSIPKIRFYPHSCLTKAEIIKKAGLVNESRQQEIAQLRENMEIKRPRDKISRINARLFESEWNNIMLKAKKATFTVALINQLFCAAEQTISEPIEHLQNIVMDEYSPQINAKRDDIDGKKKERSGSETQENTGIKPYDEELGEVE